MALRFLPGNPFPHSSSSSSSSSAIRPTYIFHWKKPFFYLMSARLGRERDVPPSAPLPPGYVFVKKGDPYVTRHCRQLTKSTGKDLFVVIDQRTNRPLGIRVPAAIHATVRAADSATKAARLAATAARDERTLAGARAALLRLFPAAPGASVDAIVAHAFRKGSGRVGRAGAMGLEERVALGVRAHVRHAWTGYEGLMRGGLGREEARMRVAERVEVVVRRWQGGPEGSPRRVSFRRGRDGGEEKEKEVEGVRRPGVAGGKRGAGSTQVKAKRKVVRKPGERMGTGVRKTKQRGGRATTTTRRKGEKRL